MRKASIIYRAMVIVTALFFSITSVAATVDPLPSWNEGSAKKAILDFVHTTTDNNNPQYVPIERRFAAFDQDGTLWVEQPMYTQVIFALDRVIALAPKHPEWKNKEPFKSVIAKNKSAIAKLTLKDLEKIVMITHTGMISVITRPKQIEAIKILSATGSMSPPNLVGPSRLAMAPSTKSVAPKSV